MSAEVRAALDTSDGTAFALRRGRKLLVDGRLAAAGRHSDRELLPWLLDTLHKQQLQIADVRDWVVGLGPGSFSGIRAGIALLQGVVCGSGARLRGLPSSLALVLAAAARQSAATRVTVLHDARRSQLIGSVYEANETGWSLTVEPAVLETTELAALLRAADAVVTPHGTAVQRVLVRDGLDSTPVLCEPVQARFLLELPESCEDRHPQHSTPTPAECTPVYVRPAVFVDPKPRGPAA